MTKKYLFVGMAVLLGASLSFFACESATGDPGAAGAAGSIGPAILYGTANVVDADELEVAFAVADTAALAATVTGVSGTIPAGKTLVVVKGEPEVTDDEVLTVKGTLEIQGGATLDASGDSVGNLAASPASITGTGVLALPYTDADYASYGTVSYAGKAAAGVDPGKIAAIFGAEDGPASLTVYDLEDITNAAVPQGKTLTLTGTGNTVTAALDLSGAAGTLVVNGKLAVSNGVTITGKATTANVTINGELALDTAATIAGNVDLSKATVSGTGGVTFTLPAGDAVVGAVSFTGQTLTIAGATGLEAGSITGSVKSASVAKYYVPGTNKASYVGLGTAADTFILKGIEDGVFTIDTSSGAFTLASALTITGAKLKTSETENGISVTNAFFALTTANLAKLAGKVTYTDAATGAAETLVVPKGLTVVAASATLASVTGLEVNGTLTASTATLATAGAKIVVGADGSATLGTVAKVLASSSVAAGGTLTVTAVTAFDSGATLAVAAEGTVNDIEFPGATTVSAIEATGVTIGSLTVPAGETLTVVKQLTVTGTLEILGDGSVSLTASTTKVVLNPGGAIDVKAATGTFGEATQTDTKVSVTGTNSGKALIANQGTVWTVTDDSTGTNDEVAIILGTLRLALTGKNAISGSPGADADTDAAAGKLIAGTGTTITFIGSD